MASSSISRAIHNESLCKNNTSSDFGKTFFLEDWWLTKAKNEIEGKRLAVSGFTYRVTHQARRLFSSAPILKIHDVFTLETTDGICVILEGFINKTRTEENGFTSDVFNHFVFGFPPNWEEYAEKCIGEGFARNAVSRMASSPQTCEKVVSKVCHVDGDKNDMGLEGREDIVLEKGQHRSACTESSVEVPKVCSSQELGVDFESGVIYITTFNNVECNSALEAAENSEKDILNKTSSISPVGFEKEKVICEEISSLSNPFDAGLTDPMDEISDPDTGSVIDGSEQGIKLSSSGANRKKHKDCGDIIAQAAKKRNEAVRCDVGVGTADGKNSRNSPIVEKASISKEASTSRKKPKRELKYESPVTRRGEERASIFSPESLSSKRSRSGRLLLPTLEFWRNQTVIYDADRRVTGIKQDMPTVQPSGGSKSEPKRKRKKLA